MKKSITAVAYILLSTMLLIPMAQAAQTPPSIQWTHTYSPSTSYYPTADYGAQAMIQTSDGGYALAGYATVMVLNLGEIITDYWLVKTDSNGTQQWSSQTSFDFGRVSALVQTGDGGFFLAGDHTMLVKTDSVVGTMQWNQTIAHGTVQSIVQSLDGGYALAGYASSAERTVFWLAKTDAHGNVIWSQTYGQPNQYDTAACVIQTRDGGYALVGGAVTVGAEPNVTGWLVKTDSVGNEEWNQTYGYSLYSIVQTKDLGYALAGSATMTPALGSSMLLVKTDASGNVQWNQTFGVNVAAHSLIQTSDGGYAMAGTDFVKTDASGNVEWNQTLPGQAYSVVQTADGAYVAGGSDADSISGAWLAKIQATGTYATPTASSPPSPSSTPSTTASLTPSPSQKPTSTPPPSVTQQPTPSPTPNSTQNNSTLAIVITGLVVATVVVGLLIYFRKRRG